MVFLTYAQSSAKILRELDLEDELFITSTELMDYYNEAIKAAESTINKINEDYFLCNTSLALVSGTSEYALPSDILADKIRSIIYSNGSINYPITRLRRHTNFQAIPLVQPADDYRYMIINSLSGGRKIKLYPASRETSSSNVTVWYLRTARQITSTADEIDLPEAWPYIQKYVKYKCYMKEAHPNLLEAVRERDEEEQNLVALLTERIVDNDTVVEMDKSSYGDQDNTWWY